MSLLVGAVAAGAAGMASAAVEPQSLTLRRLAVPDLARFLKLPEAPKLYAQSLTEDLRRRGYNECYPYDFVGLGPYAPYRRLRMGRIAIPQKGGHTPDFGYDVLVHFHGQTALRMTLAQIARGVSFVGIDLGNGSGAYSDRFQSPEQWSLLRQSIEGALRAHSGNPQAHIRHVGLMAWSAGYGAVNEILRYHADQIDAVILLDGLHASWDRTVPRRRGTEPVVAGAVAPTFEYARQAARGKGLFVFTHSEVDPVTYPSTARTAQALLGFVGIDSRSVADEALPFQRTAAADIGGLHVWSYQGNDKAAHCTHLAHVQEAIRDIVEPAWATPAMDRNVPFTPAPKLGPAQVSSNQRATRLPASSG